MQPHRVQRQRSSMHSDAGRPRLSSHLTLKNSDLVIEDFTAITWSLVSLRCWLKTWGFKIERLRSTPFRRQAQDRSAKMMPFNAHRHT